jgi:DsbC/DsbD-like thiol-disulfide interchange protein
MVIEPGWHIYWPGHNDTGLPPTFELGLPQGVTAGPVQWPPPKRYISPGDTLDHVYEDRVFLIVPLTIDASAPHGPAEVSVTSTWVVCKDVCLREKGSAQTSLVIAAAPSPSTGAQRFAEARAKLPRPLSESKGEVTARVHDGTLIIEGKEGSRLAFYPGEKSAPFADILRDGESAGHRLELELGEPSPSSRVQGIIAVFRKNQKDTAHYSVDLSIP